MLKSLYKSLTFGEGGHIVLKKNKNVLITINGEFIIPSVYSEEEMLKLEKMLDIESFETENNKLKETRTTWSSIRKKDKLKLFYNYVSSLPIPLADKIKLSRFIILALFLKLISNEDVEYNGEHITFLSDKLLKTNIYDLLMTDQVCSNVYPYIVSDTI
jgi:hypothetical protein